MILDHFLAGVWERGRDPALGSFLTVCLLAEIKNGKLWIEKGSLERSYRSWGVHAVLCYSVNFFKMEVLKWIHSHLIETWNLGLGGLFISPPYFGITFFQLTFLNKSFSSLYGNSLFFILNYWDFPQFISDKSLLCLFFLSCISMLSIFFPSPALPYI